MHRWQKVLQPGLKKGKWSEEEDKILINWVNKNGPNKWSKLSSVLKGRSSKQIRDRWINNLNPERAKNFIWNNQLDKILIIKYLQLGSKWVKISKFIPNSTENMIKNRFYSLLRSVASKQLRGFLNKKLEKDKLYSNLNSLNLSNFNNSNQVEKFYQTTGENLPESGELLEENLFENIQNNNENSSAKKRRNNYSLSYLINFLPNLIEEKKIDINNLDYEEQKELDKINNTINYSKQNLINSLNKIKEESSFNCQFYETSTTSTERCSNFNEEQRKILINFFNTLSQRIPHREDYQNSSNMPQDEKTKAQFKLKSTILLNLQLHLLHKIFERIKLHIINRFFQQFKNGNNVMNSFNMNMNIYDQNQNSMKS